MGTTIVRMLEFWIVKGRKKFKAKDRVRNTKLSNIPRKDVKAREIRHAEEVTQSGGFIIRDIKEKDPTLDKAKNFEWTLPFPKRGWGRRPKKCEDGGRLYGKSYLSKYKTEIKEFFTEGKKDSSKK